MIDLLINILNYKFDYIPKNKIYLFFMRNSIQTPFLFLVINFKTYQHLPVVKTCILNLKQYSLIQFYDLSRRNSIKKIKFYFQGVAE